MLWWITLVVLGTNSTRKYAKCIANIGMCLCQNRTISPNDMPTISKPMVKNAVRNVGITKPAKTIIKSLQVKKKKHTLKMNHLGHRISLKEMRGICSQMCDRILFYWLIWGRLLTVIWPEANQSTSQSKTKGEKMMEFVFQKNKKTKCYLNTSEEWQTTV